ncbi:hypothetical protein JBP901_gp037 [Bacillus phage JBP901]|uniref:Uncharacterized protein n=2 Tax=Caeruleovirus TaxID=1911929 RepID=A0A0E3DEK7_9CAUD|nr:hypothetical protein JBP901_gp037 [Bacillus phage JBP901]YP_009149629.1 hypothetical protein BCP8-2_068 [Bacillus phage BCP8-2]AHJ87106.1 hypothetical protein BCP8-2_068 [Bacillus phage BCP8-2]AID17750.1 hypothetical protein JBP901_gp037 [Bacillus phage JBP901]
MTELNCNEVVNQWRNFGDDSPIEYGTVFVKADVEQENCFYVIHVISRDWTEGINEWLLSYGYVDLNDDWIDWKAIKNFSGIQRHDETEEGYKVSALVEYYGIHEFGGEPLNNSFTVCENGVFNVSDSEAETIHILKEFGINMKGSEEVIKLTVNVSNESYTRYYKASDIDYIGLTVDEETFIEIDGEKTIVSESLEQLQTMLEGYDVEILAEEEDDNE